MNPPDTTPRQEPIPDIQSAFLNIDQARKDCEYAKELWGSLEFQDCVDQIDSATSQLESARAKIVKHCYPSVFPDSPFSARVANEAQGGRE